MKGLLVLITTLITISHCQRFGGNQQNYNTNYNNAPAAPLGGGGVSCPERNGTFPTSTCDGYIECKDGVGEEKLCPDGLLFNPEVRGYPCQYPIDVDCAGRTATQPAQPTEECPHQYGYFRLGDATHCGQFMNCAAGRGFTFDCPEGLAFNAASYRCDWPDQVPDCDAEAYFSCPPPAKGFFGFGEEYRFFRSPADCQRYFVCIEGKPRAYVCGEGQAFNELTNTCDGAENVTGCAQNYNPNFDSRQQQNQQQFRG